MTNDSRLKKNINLLGKILGEEIYKSEGKAVFDKIERIRKLSKASRSSNTDTQAQLLDLLYQLQDHELLPIVRAFSHFLNLVNIAEQHNNLLQDGGMAGSVEETLNKALAELADENKSKQQVLEAIKTLKIDLVLTAHPTEIVRRSLINKHVEINHCLGSLESEHLTDTQRQQTLLRLRELVAHIWHTNEFRPMRPTPIDEAKWGLAVLEKSLWEAVPGYLRRLNLTLQQRFGEGLPLTVNPISFISWMGGDRDGNPNVTATVTRQVILLNRCKAANLYLGDITQLIDELSMSKSTDSLRELTGGAKEPYRQVLRNLRQQLENTRNATNCELAGEEYSGGNIIETDEQLWEPLHACYQSLRHCGLDTIANGKLLDTLRRIKCFGLYLFKMDIRQESARHTQVLSELTQYLQLGDYDQWPENRRQQFLLTEMNSKRPLIPDNWQPSDQAKEVLNCCREIARLPEQVIAGYVISMAQATSDVLAVTLLLKACGCQRAVPVVPLFETLKDLEQAGAIINQLLSLPGYRKTLQGKQMVMIGYSDSAKDAGVLAAGWAQYRAQEELLNICGQAGVSLTLFHGRGGTIGRGGAPTHAALLSQPPGSLENGLRVTVQGEMIRAEFGLSMLAENSLAMYTSAILKANLSEPPEPSAEWRQLMQQLAQRSCQVYRQVVRGNKEFVNYFRAATPEKELGVLSLGSRPARRQQDGGISSLRAIPWIFAWSQNRLMLPAWLGAGSALAQMIDSGQRQLLETMCRKWPFFSTRLSLLEMVFLKADPTLAAYYDERLVDKKLRCIGVELRKQLEKDIETLLTISNDGSLMHNLPSIKESVQIRNTYSDPLNYLQAELLTRHRSQADKLVEQALMITISGIAAGMRNTG